MASVGVWCVMSAGSVVLCAGTVVVCGWRDGGAGCESEKCGGGGRGHVGLLVVVVGVGSPCGEFLLFFE